MQVRKVILIATSSAVALALALLFVQAGATPSVDVPEDALEAARQRHERAERVSSMQRAPVQPKTSSLPTIKRSVNRDKPQVEDEPEVRQRATPPRTRRGATLRPAAGSSDLDTRMAETNKLYDRRDYEGALAAAQEILKESPGNIRMLRVVVSSSCIMGDEPGARQAYDQLPPRHQRQMRRRCQRYGVELPAPER